MIIDNSFTPKHQSWEAERGRKSTKFIRTEKEKKTKIQNAWQPTLYVDVDMYRKGKSN